MTDDIIKPIVNLNGTSRDALFDQQLAVFKALDLALIAMAQATPHGRDYQTQPGLYEQAASQHRRRVEMVHAAREAAFAIALHLRKDRP